MKMLDLFSGIGGFSYGMESSGLAETVGFCEIDPFCREVLKKHWPGVWIHDDITTLTGQLVLDKAGPVDLLCGGFPCQDISCAGKGAGLKGSRSGLWWELFRLIRELRPRWLCIENVPALRTRGADRVLNALAAEGYASWPLVVGAVHVGAPHKRERVWIVGYSRSATSERNARELPSPETRERGKGQSDGRFADRPELAGSSEHQGDVADSARHGERGQRPTKRADRKRTRASGDKERPDVSDGSIERLEEREGRVARNSFDTAERSCLPSRWPARPGEPQHDWEAQRLAQFGVGCDSHGLPERLARFANRSALRAYGNTIVPQVAAAIGRSILRIEA